MNQFYNHNSFKVNSFNMYSFKLIPGYGAQTLPILGMFRMWHMFETETFTTHVIRHPIILFYFCFDTPPTRTGHYSGGMRCLLFIMYCAISMMYGMNFNCKQ